MLSISIDEASFRNLDSIKASDLINGLTAPTSNPADVSDFCTAVQRCIELRIKRENVTE